jgi:anaerobic selenocysteine-containing dehydrogenase
MGAVHASRGRLAPPSEDLLSEVAIIARLSALVFGAASAPSANEDESREEVLVEASAPLLKRDPRLATRAAGPDPARHDRGYPERSPAEEAAVAVAASDPAALEHPVNVPHADWGALEADYALIRAHIERVVPGFEDFEERIDKGRTLHLPNGPRDARLFATADGKARFTVNPLEYPRIPRGRLLLQTLRSHDQYNTTIYGKDDRYRGIHGGRRVVLVNAKDIVALGFAENDVVDLVSEWRRPGGSVEERRAEEFRIVAYRTPRGNAAAYYPETNVLVPLDSVADVSGTPTSKSVLVRLERRS